MLFQHAACLFQFKFIRYGLIGICSTGIHIFVAFLFIRFIAPSIFLSNIAGFLIALNFSYYTQLKWVFDSRFTSLKFFKYFFVQAASLIIAIIASNTLDHLSIYLKTVVTAFILPVITFFVHKVWTFADS